MIFFRAGIIAAMLSGLAAPVGQSVGTILSAPCVSASARFAEPTHSTRSRSRILRYRRTKGRNRIDPYRFA